jgi:hypothetical protein
LPDDDSKAQRAIKPSAIAIATLEDTPKPSIATILAAITHNRFPNNGRRIHGDVCCSS